MFADGPTSPPTVVLQGGSDTIAAVRPNAAGGALHVWTRPGIGGFTRATPSQGQHEFSGVALADGDGDGRAEIIVISTSGRVYGIGRRQPGAVAAALVDDRFAATRPGGLETERERPAIRPAARSSLLLAAIDTTVQIEAAFAASAEAGQSRTEDSLRENTADVAWQDLADQLL